MRDIRQREYANYKALMGYPMKNEAGNENYRWVEKKTANGVEFKLKPSFNAIKTTSSYISWILEEEAPFDQRRTKVYSLSTDEHKFWTAMVDWKDGYIRIQNKVKLK